MPPSRRDELVDAAMKVFGREGFHGTGIERVLEEAGVSRMTLYNHFRSKDDLIVAALRRQDELSRHALMRYVDAQNAAGAARVLAVFDHYEAWFGSRSFDGCMFINAAAEFGDPEHAIRRTAVGHKDEVHRYLASLCADAGIDDAVSTAHQLQLLIDGAIVTAQRVDDPEPRRSAARVARRTAEQILAARGVASA